MRVFRLGSPLCPRGRARCLYDDDAVHDAVDEQLGVSKDDVQRLRPAHAVPDKDDWAPHLVEGAFLHSGACSWLWHENILRCIGVRLN